MIKLYEIRRLKVGEQKYSFDSSISELNYHFTFYSVNKMA